MLYEIRVYAEAMLDTNKNGFHNSCSFLDYRVGACFMFQ